MSLRNSARTGRDVYWTRRGMDEFGGVGEIVGDFGSSVDGICGIF